MGGGAARHENQMEGVMSDDGPAIPAFVARAIWYLSEKHTLDHDTDYLRRSNQFCDLVTTSESHWVAAFCDYILRKACSDHQQVTFNRFFEIPSLDSEAHERAGYDLSAGPFDTNARYRFMHKTCIAWCDENWSWDVEAKNDRKHLAAILGANHQPLRRHKTFFVLHVFRCIHDWRRMGMEFCDRFRGNETYRVPGLSSLLRTVVIALDSLKNGYDSAKWVRIQRTAHKYETGPAQGYLNGIATPGAVACEVGGRAITPITLDDLCGSMAAEWQEGGMWNRSAFK
jgi:hypothetical protein